MPIDFLFYTDCMKKMGEGEYKEALQGFEQCIAKRVEWHESIQLGMECAKYSRNKEKFFKLAELSLKSWSQGIGPYERISLPSSDNAQSKSVTFWSTVPDEWKEDFLTLIAKNRFSFEYEYCLEDYVKYLITNREYDRALEFGLQVMDRFKEHFKLNDILRIAYYKNKIAEAIQIIEREIEIKKKGNLLFSDEYFGLSILYAYLGDKEKASKIFSEQTRTDEKYLPFNRRLETEELSLLRSTLFRKVHWQWTADLLYSLYDMLGLARLYIKNEDQGKAIKILETNYYAPLFKRLKVAEEYNLECKSTLSKLLEEKLTSAPPENKVELITSYLPDCGKFRDAILEAESYKKNIYDSSYFNWVTEILEFMERVEKALEIYETRIARNGQEVLFNEHGYCFQQLARLYFKNKDYFRSAEALRLYARYHLIRCEEYLYSASKLYSLGGHQEEQITTLHELERILVNSGRAQDIALIYFGEGLYDEFNRVCKEENLTKFANSLYKEAGISRPIKKTISRKTKKSDDSKRCTNCGKLNEGHLKFCTKCGTPLNVTPKICSKCGTALEADDLFCGKCGIKVQ